MSWRDQAACVGKPVEWFFPASEHGSYALYKLGKAVCAACPVITECAAEHRRAERETGMALPGLWAGATSADRRSHRPRLEERLRTPRTCVACGAAFQDKGRGAPPRFCSTSCTWGAGERLRVGA